MALHKYNQYSIVLIVGAVLALFYSFPYVYYGEDSHLLIHDNLDSSYVIYKLLVDSGAVFQGNDFVIAPLLNGVARGNFPSELDVNVWLNAVFSPYTAYVINRTLMTLVGYCGFFLLLKKHLIPKTSSNVITHGVAICFATLPFWPFGGLGIAGMPLVLFALLNIRKEKQAWYNWLILFAYPFYSHLVFVGFFVIFVNGLLLVSDFYNKKQTKSYFAGLLFLSLMYILTHYRLFEVFLFNNSIVSHRVEFAAVYETSLKQALGKGLSVLLKGQYHANSLHNLILIPVVFLGLSISLIQKKINKYVIYTLALLVLTALLYAVFHWSAFDDIKRQVYATIPMQFDRFYVLYPVFWMGLFAYSLFLLWSLPKVGGVLVVFALASQALYQLSYYELWVNREKPSLSEFFAEKQFQHIDAFIGMPKSEYKVISLGLHPSIALYNGFYNFDGYFSSYPLEHKKKFKEIISEELEKDKKLKRKFDRWGSRAYLFSSELHTSGFGFNDYLKGNDFEIQKLRVNADVLTKHGVHYVISAYKINLARNENLYLEKKFTSNESAWDIYLYKVAS